MPRTNRRLPWLMEAISRTDSKDCLLWPYAANKLGYGIMSFHGKQQLVHRVAFLLTNGRWPIPCGLHTCDNPACFNPAHIYEGDDAANTRDKLARGRARCAIGERVNTVKLNPEMVRKIRSEYIRGRSDRNQVQLSEKYGICQTAISSIVRGQSWKHIR